MAVPARASFGADGVRELPPFSAMTTTVCAWIPASAPAARVRGRLRRVFRVMERRLTRFRADSELRRLCARGGGTASPALFRALSTARRAWRRSGGLFDPRLRDVLEALGYGADLRFGGAISVLPPRRRPLRPPAAQLWPGPRSRATALQSLRQSRPLLPWPAEVDLGGIGKGLTLRYAARNLRRLCGGTSGLRSGGPCGVGKGSRPGFLVNAGGDIWAEGGGPQGTGWTVGIPAPADERQALAVLCVTDRTVCTSSRGRRRWIAGGREAHHLIDPRTGAPADGGLWSVTVIGRDPAWAEVWSKTLFVAGADSGLALAERRGLAAVFCTPEGELISTCAAGAYLRPLAERGQG